MDNVSYVLSSQLLMHGPPCPQQKFYSSSSSWILVRLRAASSPISSFQSSALPPLAAPQSSCRRFVCDVMCGCVANRPLWPCTPGFNSIWVVIAWLTIVAHVHPIFFFYIKQDCMQLQSPTPMILTSNITILSKRICQPYATKLSLKLQILPCT